MWNRFEINQHKPSCSYYDDVIKWKHFPRYRSFVRGIHRSPVNSLHKGQWRGALMFSLICVWINGLIKQSWGWWFKTPESSLWRHSFVLPFISIKAPYLLWFHYTLTAWDTWRLCITVRSDRKYNQGRRPHVTLQQSMFQFQTVLGIPRQWLLTQRWRVTRPSLVQIMACRLFDTKPLSEPMMAYCQLDHWDHILVICESKYKFQWRKIFWKCCMQTGGRFVSVLARCPAPCF